MKAYAFLYDNTENEEGYNERQNDRIIIFTTAQMLNEIAAKEAWMTDETFKISPILFSELYTIVVVADSDHVFPCVYALLPDKTFAIYRKFFEIL